MSLPCLQLSRACCRGFGCALLPRFLGEQPTSILPHLLSKPAPQSNQVHILTSASEKGRTSGSTRPTDPLPGTLSKHAASPDFVSSVHQGNSTCSVPKEHQGPGTAQWQQARLAVRVHTVSQHSLQTATPQASVQNHTCPTPLSPTPEVGSEGEGHGVSLLLLGYVRFSGPKPLSPHS